jgi:hypothetical protein
MSEYWFKTFKLKSTIKEGSVFYVNEQTWRRTRNNPFGAENYDNLPEEGFYRVVSKNTVYSNLSNINVVERSSTSIYTVDLEYVGQAIDSFNYTHNP